MKKRILIIILSLLGIVFLNGCYYVFHGQFRSADKIREGKELNLYEKASIYSMHACICTMGWIYSPEATKEVIGMSFRANRGKVIKKENDFFLSNRKVASIYKSQYTKKRVAFNGDVSYALGHPDHRVALAINPGFLWRDAEKVYMEVPVHYPICYDTHIGITKNVSITLNECLFSYLEGKGILHPYTVIYYASID